MTASLQQHHCDTTEEATTMGRTTRASSGIRATAQALRVYAVRQAPPNGAHAIKNMGGTTPSRPSQHTHCAAELRSTRSDSLTPNNRAQACAAERIRMGHMGGVGWQREGRWCGLE